MTSSYYLNQCLLIVNKALRNIHVNEILLEMKKFSFKEMQENVICKVATICSGLIVLSTVKSLI